MRTEEVTDGSRLSAATRYELLVGVSNAIGTHRNPEALFGALVRELHRVVRFDYIGVYIRDEKSNTFHRHSVDAETEAAILPDPELAMEDSDAWWVYQNQEPLITSLEARDGRFSKLQEVLKKYGVLCLCTLPLTTAHTKVGTLAFASKAPDVYTGEEVQFLTVVAEQIALAFDNALLFDAAQASQQQLLKKSERVGLLLELTNHVVSNLEFRDLLRAVVASTRRVMGCDGVGITLPDTDNSHLRIFHAFCDRIVAELVRVVREPDRVDRPVSIGVKDLARSVALVRYHDAVRLRKVRDHLRLAEPRLDAVYSPAPMNLQHFHTVIPINGGK